MNEKNIIKYKYNKTILTIYFSSLWKPENMLFVNVWNRTNFQRPWAHEHKEAPLLSYYYMGELPD